MFKAALAAGLGAVLLSGTAAWAQTPPEQLPVNRADLQCLGVIAVAFTQVGEGSDEQIGFAAAVGYYLGRLEARASGVNWLNAFEAYLTTELEKDLDQQADRCAGEMVSFGGRLAAWGEKMGGDAKSSAKEARPSPHRP